jgi:benzodiazapine receptor
MLHQSDSADMKLKLWVILPFTVYLAWICVATIANIAAWLIALGWQGGSIPPQLWTILMMTIAAALALKVTIDYRVPFFSLVVIWALFGIYFRWHNSSYSSITIAAMVLMTFLAVGIFYVMRKRTTA